jgi:hypothetical protein
MRKIVATYDYRDQNSVLRYQVTRWNPKGFSQRAPDGRGDWKRDNNGRLTMQGIELIPYRLDLVAAAALELREHGSIPQAIIVEGEKDADRLIRGGFLASCNAGGAGKWFPDFAKYFAGFEIVLLPDHDKPGRDHMHQVGRSMLGIAAEVRLLDLGMTEAGQDFSDWADGGGTPRALKGLIAAAPALTLADLPPLPAPIKHQARALPDRLSPYARSALESASKRIVTAPNGVQQKTVNMESFSVGQLVGAGVLPEGEAFGLLLAAAADMPNFDPRRPWHPAELRRIVQRSFSAGLRKPRGIPESRDRRYG